MVCLSPGEVSVNCVKGGIKDVYVGGFAKGDGTWGWYEFFGNYGGYVSAHSCCSCVPCCLALKSSLSSADNVNVRCVL